MIIIHKHDQFVGTVLFSPDSRMIASYHLKSDAYNKLAVMRLQIFLITYAEVREHLLNRISNDHYIFG
jgi:hypothetical protein